MELKLSKWGNSKAIRIPRELLEKLNVDEEGTLFFATISEDKIILTKKKKEKTKFELLMEKSKGLKIRPNEFIDMGDPIGDEYW